MKVLFLTTSFPRGPGDYAGIFVFHLARRLRNAGVAVTVVAPNDGFQLAAEIREGVVIRRFHFWLNKRQAFLSGGGGLPEHLRKRKALVFLMPFFLFSFLKSALREAKAADVIQCLWLPLGLLGMIAGGIRRKPFLVNLRGSDKVFARFPFRFYARTIVRRSRAVVAVSPELLRILPPGGRRLVIPNGVDVGAKTPVPLDTSVPIILFIGSLSRNKSVMTLLQAAAGLGDDVPFGLVIVGDGPEKPALERFVEANRLGGRVRFQSPLAQGEIFYLMEKSRVLVLPSLSEGRSNVILEAMASGLPVIASGIPENREIIRDGETGLLFEPLQAEALRDRIERLWRDPALRAALAEGGRRWIRDSGSTWDAAARAYAHLYEDILGREAGASRLDRKWEDI